MRLEDTSRLGDVQDVIDNIQIFIVLIELISPFLILLICITAFRLIRKALNRRAQQKKIQRKQLAEIKAAQKVEKKKIDKLYKNDEFLYKQLDGTKEPYDKSNYSSLDITIDKNGKVIK